MYDLQHLANSYLPIDKLIHEFRLGLIGINYHKHFTKWTSNKMVFHSYITLSFIKNPEVRKSVQSYISKLISFKKEYGYLYYLNTQKLIVPLKNNLTFNPEFVFDPANYTEITEEINSLANQFGCPTTNSTFYDITLIEILYYLTILVNPHLNWITVDFVLRGNRTHDYLISSKDRIIIKTWPSFG